VRRDSPPPLKPIVFHILLVLMDGERHGWTIVREIEKRMGGQKVLPANLYRTLRTMLRDDLIEESDRRPDQALDDERRRYFRITPAGLRTARLEAERLDALVAEARSRRLLSPQGRTRTTQP
jgi:DNA-binding PadR family transcriptional regulator